MPLRGGSTWKSSVGDWEGVAVRASAQRTVLAGYGADRPVAYVAGGGSPRGWERVAGPAGGANWW